MRADRNRFDPSGFILEHYVDGDLLDMNEPSHHTKAGPGNLHVWGEYLETGGGSALVLTALQAPRFRPPFCSRELAWEGVG